MNHVIRADSISVAWLKAVIYLLSVGGGCYNLVVEVADPLLENEAIRLRLNGLLKSKGQHEIETVANTIFPRGLYRQLEGRSAFYQRFFGLYPQIRNVAANNRGTYFGRMVAWNDVRGTGIENQLEQLIIKFHAAREREETCVMHELPIYNPSRDAHITMGFPCMSYIVFSSQGNILNINAVYRNQFFVKKAYGNFLGLSRLLAFICEHTGYQLGRVTCTATHAELDLSVKTELRRIAEEFQKQLQPLIMTT